MERREIAEHGKMYRALTSEPAAASAASGALAAAMHALLFFNVIVPFRGSLSVASAKVYYNKGTRRDPWSENNKLQLSFVVDEHPYIPITPPFHGTSPAVCWLRKGDLAFPWVEGTSVNCMLARCVKQASCEREGSVGGHSE